MREPSRNNAEHHRFRPDSGCLLYFERRIAATAISNDRDQQMPGHCLLSEICQRTYDQRANRKALS